MINYNTDKNPNTNIIKPETPSRKPNYYYLEGIQTQIEDTIIKRQQLSSAFIRTLEQQHTH